MLSTFGSFSGGALALLEATPPVAGRNTGLTVWSGCAETNLAGVLGLCVRVARRGDQVFVPAG